MSDRRHRFRAAALLLSATAGWTTAGWTTAGWAAPAIAQPVDLPDAPAVAAAPPIRAQLMPRQSTFLASQLAGRIVELTVKEGESFKAGQTLAAIDCAVPRARLARAAAAREAARLNAQVKRRLHTLNSGSSLEAELAAAEAAQAEADVQEMTARVGYCTVSAPFAGRVAELKVRRHQSVAEGEALMEILESGELEVQTMVPSSWLAWLKPGEPLTIRIDETGREYPAEVVRLGARIDSVNQSIKLFARIVGQFNDLVPGMSGTPRFATRP